ncbi:MAG: hypothetical protein JST66_10410 [Bacteroidetes bacterium]|nr:hypothetical protein [Bacteroidota bacterium]
MEDRHEHEELRRLAPTLGGIPKCAPFVAPDAFFAHFPHRVQALVGTPERRPAAWWRRTAIALPVLAVLGTGAWWLGRKEAAPVPATAIALQATDLSDEDLETLDLPELLAGADGPSPWTDVHLDLSEAELLAYAEHEGLDLTELTDRP